MSEISKQLAKDFMVCYFNTIRENSPVGEGINKLLHSITRKSGYKTESLMVVDRDDNTALVGVVTIFDILYHLRPSFLHQGFHGDFLGSEIQWDERVPELVGTLREKKIKQIMTKNVISAKPDEHIMSVVDSMVKNRYRRLPVVDESKLVGIIYLSDIYNKVFKYL